MIKITKKYIFERKLKGEPITIYTDTITKDVIRVLIDTGILGIDKAGSNSFWAEHSYSIRYPIQMIENCGTIGGYNLQQEIYLESGDHHIFAIDR